jgi:hypothetical protein
MIKFEPAGAWIDNVYGDPTLYVGGLTSLAA